MVGFLSCYPICRLRVCVDVKGLAGKTVSTSSALHCRMQDPPPDAMSEQRRQELIEMGFPDDGYDYLKHMRAGSRAAAGAAELVGGAEEPSVAAGPSVFVAAQLRQPLEDDEKLFDARQLVIHQPAADDVRIFLVSKVFMKFICVHTHAWTYLCSHSIMNDVGRGTRCACMAPHSSSAFLISRMLLAEYETCCTLVST